MRVAILWLGVAAWAAAGDAPAVTTPHAAASPPNVTAPAEADPEAVDRGDPPRPGDASPASAVEPCAFRFNWGEVGDDYVSVVVVGAGVGIVRPAWVATWKRGDKPPGEEALQVAYRATAFRDERGRVHVDARHAEVTGPIADRWSPDSFAFGYKKLWTCDDRGDGHASDLGETIPAATKSEEYRKLLRQVQALVEGGL